jgi:hypothetical protein
MNLKSLVPISLISISLSFLMPAASADTDPFPGVENGATIPGTELYGSPGQSQVDFEASPQRQSHTCPTGSGRGGGVDLAFTSDRSKHSFFTNCVKTWQSSATIDAEAKYRADLAVAQASALAQSLAWNTANPGQQKCFQWGPITSPSGGTSSGGVCANPVGTAPTTSESISETSTGTTSGSSGSSTGSSSSSSDTGTVSIPPSSGVAEVVEVSGQGDCPGGNDGWRRGLEVNATTGRTVTRCVRIETIVIATGPNTTTTITRVVGTDPYPNLATGAEIPGTRTLSTSETSWAQFATTSMRSGWACPAIYGPNGDPYAAENNGFDSSAGKWFRVCVKNPWREATPTIKSISDTKTVTSQTDTRTVTTKTELISQSETRTAQVAEVTAILNTKERIMAAVVLIKTFDSAEREQALDVTYKSKKSSAIDVDLAVPRIPVVVTATKKGSPTITLKSTTDAEGDAQIKTTKNLEGYSVTLTINKTKIDTDVVKKKK